MQKALCPGAEDPRRPSTVGQCSERGWPELGPFARVEGAGCLKNSWDNLSPNKRTAFTDKGNQTERCRRQV
jgi:hypothetical protein